MAGMPRAEHPTAPPAPGPPGPPGYNPRMSDAPAANDTSFCPACGYDLRGSADSDHCPECGQATDDVAMRLAQVPWSHRAHIGRGRALLRTAWRVMFRTKTFCYAVGQPVSYADARRFQLTVISLLWLISMIVAGFLVFATDDDAGGPFAWSETLGQAMPVLLLLAIAGGWFLCLLLGTGLHTYWCHPKTLSVERQNRAVALSYYACAPLLWAIPPLVLIPIGVVVATIGDDSRNEILFYAGVFLTLIGLAIAAAMIVGFVIVCFIMAGQAARRGTLGRFTLLFCQPLLLALLAALTVGGLPFVVVYLRIIAMTW